MKRRGHEGDRPERTVAYREIWMSETKQSYDGG